jgi:lipoyl(octanoyl) transferase
MPDIPLSVKTRGIEPYEPVWREMQEFTRERTNNTPDELWCLQHEPVFTLGQAGKPGHVLNAHNIPVIKCDRGGQVTYHGPGQLVIYLLIDLRRRGMGPRALVDLIEQALIRMLAGYSINAEVKAGAPGVYVDGKKIGALGLRVRRGASYHGLSLNIDMDQSPFTFINPCGYEGLQSVQMKDLLTDAPATLFDDVQKALVGELGRSLLQCDS